MVGRIFFTVFCCFFLVGHRFEEPMMPEKLLGVDTNRMTFSVTSKPLLNDFKDWVFNDKPSVAYFACKSSHCNNAVSVLEDLNVKLVPKKGESDVISLYYNHVIAFNCPKNRFGCSVSDNLVNSVDNWDVFHDPDIISMPSVDHLLKKY